MWINHVLLGLLGLLFGLSVASGSFALAVKLGIVPAMAERSSTASHIITYENTIILVGIFGNIISVFTQIKLPLGSVFLAVYGLGAGIFTGCMVVALAEIVDVFPIMFRRVKLKIGLSWVVITLALGKLCGALYYFINNMDE